MSAVAQAAHAYREAVQAHRDAKQALETALRDARLNEGLSVPDLAELSGYSRQRVYQLLALKEEKSMIGQVTCTRPDGSRFFVVGVRYALKSDNPEMIRVDDYANSGAKGYADQGTLTLEPGNTPLELY